ncbi:MAG: rhodanese-like domain-containing protein [Flavobacteriales bacterium]|jgi:rhodanese-related sulfurtransferase|nr:rhodanese-like domain-containing protein [Flavobacteriales bacterium]
MKKLGILATFLSMISGGMAQTAENVENIGKSQLETVLDTKNIVVLDIRTPQEFHAGHLPKAKNINYFDRDFAQKIQKLDKNVPYLLYCRSGNRSGSALRYFKEFKKIYHLNRGYGAL